MHPRIPVALTPADCAAIARRSRRMLAVCFVIIAAALALLALQRTSDNGAIAQERPLALHCTQWDDLASAAIVQRVQDKLDLKELGDAIFRMRRARNSCDGGWFWLACEDYQAIIAGAPGPTRPFPESPPPCTLAEPDALSAPIGRR